MADAKYLLWIDLETTGTDDEADPILEVGLIVTGAKPPFEELAEHSWVINPADGAANGSWRGRMDDYVREMHTKNGLLNEVEDPEIAVTMARAQAEVTNLLSTVGRKHNFMLAGSGVGHFDRRFIRRQMPEVEKWLQYPNLDIGVLRRAFRFAGRNDLTAFGTTLAPGATDKPHRGLDDVRDHLAEWRIYSGIFNAIPGEEDIAEAVG